MCWNRLFPITSVDIQDLITCATFCDDRLRGLGVARGRISRFPIDLRRRPYNTLALSCECVSLPKVVEVLVLPNELTLFKLAHNSLVVFYFCVKLFFTKCRLCCSTTLFKYFKISFISFFIIWMMSISPFLT